MYQFTPWARMVMTLASDLMDRDLLRITGVSYLAYSAQPMTKKKKKKIEQAFRSRTYESR